MNKYLKGLVALSAVVAVGVAIPGTGAHAATEIPVSINNGGFENGENGWIFEGTGECWHGAGGGIGGDAPYTGSNKYYFYGPSENYTAKIHQTLNNLDNGTYIVRAMVQQNNGYPSLSTMELTGFGGNLVKSDIPHSDLSQGDSYKEITATAEVTNGTLDIAFHQEASANTNLQIDNVTVVRVVDSIEDVVGSINSIIDQFTFTNSTTQADVENELVNISNNQNITSSVQGFDLTEATETTTGSAAFVVQVVDNTNTTPVSVDLPFNKEIAQLPHIDTIEDVIDLITSTINALIFTNDTTQTDVENALVDISNNPDITSSVQGFNLTNATTSAAGSVVFTIEVSDNTDTTPASVDFDIEIAQLDSTGDETTGDETTGDETTGDETTGDETTGDETTGDETTGDETTGDETTGDETTGDETTGDETTGDETTGDETTGDETTGDETTGDETTGDETTGDETTDDEGTTKLELSDSKLKDFLEDYASYNNTSESTVRDRIISEINDDSIEVTITNFNLKSADYKDEGLCEFVVTLTSGDESVSVNYSDTIPKVKRHYSTNSNSKSQSENSATNSAAAASAGVASTTTTTTTNNTATDNTTTSTTDITNVGINKVVDAETAKKIAKIATEKVISTLSEVVGEGVTATEVKEVTTVDGNKLKVTVLNKDKKYTGSVITVEKDSATATIPVDSASGQVTAVYKFVPQLGKYIQLKEGVTIGAEAITLPTQANATYYAATVPMASTETVTQGWAKVADSWYLVNATGDPQTGWQKDNTGWTYLSQDNGVMQTGWIKEGKNWYHLKPNGYMTTGWVKTNDKWHYLNTDGSMASNTTVDGYTLDSNGAWIG